MAKYRKKPVFVEAEQYRPGLEDGWEYEDELLDDITPGMYAASKVDIVRMYPYMDRQGWRDYISAGDYIVTNGKGHKYLYKPEIFDAIFEPAWESI